MRIVITGTPGTGKSSLAKDLAKRIHYPLLDVRKLIEKRRIFKIMPGESEKTVNLRALQRLVKAWFRDHPDGIAESHLLCEFDAGGELVVALRCRPDVLESRLKKRRYGAAKIRENVLAEALDYCLQKAEANAKQSRRVIQIDTTRRISAEAFARKVAKEASDEVDWSAWLRKNAARITRAEPP